MTSKAVSRTNRGVHSEKGSALLIVLVFAAIVAILLYREMPIAAFEAQRQKEEVTVDRGNEYKRAVKLFVRKFGRFPGSLDELENTNRMRFLRRRYADPLTGKDDWRLLHAGPGGVIIDSKVKTNTAGGPGSDTKTGTGSTFAGFNNAFVGGTADATDAPTVASSVAARQRPPAVSSNGSSTPGAASSDFPPMPGQNPVPIPDQNGSNPDAAAPSNPAGQNVADGTNPAQSAGTPTAGAMMALQRQRGLLGQNAGLPAGQANGDPMNSGDAGSDPTTALLQQLKQPNPQLPNGQQPNAQQPAQGQTAQAANGQNGQTTGGGIAGVASKAQGHSIIVVNDQTRYSLWEFFYDMQKEQSGGAAAALQGMQAGANAANQQGQQQPQQQQPQQQQPAANPFPQPPQPQ